MNSWTPINFYTAPGAAITPQSLQPSATHNASILGEDNNRYAIIQNDDNGPGTSHTPDIYCYDNNTTIHYGATSGFADCVARMQSDIATLALPGAPASTNFTWINESFGIANTQYFMVMGLYEPNSLDGDYLVFIRYKLNASSAIQLVDGFIVRCSAAHQFGHFHEINLRGLKNQSLLVDCRIIGSNLYIAGSGQSVTDNIYDTILLNFPLSIFGTCNTTAGSYETFVTTLAHGPMYLYPFGPSYVNGQRGQVVQIGGNVGLLAYAGAGAITGSSFGNQFFAGGSQYNGNPRLIFASDNLGFTDYGPLYGVPFPDTLYNFAGTLTTNINNDYNGPSIITNGSDTYVVFTRIFNDSIQNMRMRLFTFGTGATVMDYIGSFWSNGYFPANPNSFSPVNVFFSPTGNRHLILQSDYLNQPTTGIWRLYADFGVPVPPTPHYRCH